MVRSCIIEGFSISVLPTTHIFVDTRCLFGMNTRIDPSYVLQDRAKEFEPLDRRVAVVKVFVNVSVRHRRSDRFTYFGELMLKLGYHGLLIFDGIRPKDGSDAGNLLPASIFAIVGRKDGFPVEVVSHVGNDDGDDDDDDDDDYVGKQMQGC